MNYSEKQYSENRPFFILQVNAIPFCNFGMEEYGLIDFHLWFKINCFDFYITRCKSTFSGAVGIVWESTTVSRQHCMQRGVSYH